MTDSCGSAAYDPDNIVSPALWGGRSGSLSGVGSDVKHQHFVVLGESSAGYGQIEFQEGLLCAPPSHGRAGRGKGARSRRAETSDALRRTMGLG